MKHICFIFCVLLMITYVCLSDSSRGNTKNDERDGGIESKGCLSGGRTKRRIGSRLISLVATCITATMEIIGPTASGAAMIKGLRARQKLLKDLTPVKKFKFLTYYEKNGGVTKMIEDFDAVNPTNVYPYKINGMTVGRKGRVGDRMISYDTGSTSVPRAITLAKTKRNGDVIVDIITYR